MRESRLFIILISLVMGLAGCSKETMIGEYVDRCAVRLDIDWGPCGIDPDGMTALFYPVDGGEPSRFLTNTVTGDEVRLRKGIYNVVVFNQAAEEYSYLTIEGQDQYSTLRIVMKTTDSDWYTPDEGERLIYDPEPFAVATLEGFEVTQEMVRANLKEGKEFSLACRPEKVIFTTHLSLEIKGLHNVRTARGSIKGMADTYWIADRKTGSSVATQLVDFSEKTFHENSTTDGILASSMEHEFIHMYQRDVQGKKVDTDKEKRDTGMMEFELAFYQGIIRYIHAGYSWTFKGEDGDPSYQSLWTSGLTDPSLIPQYEREFQTYVASICANGKPTSIDINEFVKWSNIFGEYSRGYSGKGYKFGNYDYGTSCINSLLKLY